MSDKLIVIEKRVYIKTFGCQMNEHDSEQMLALLRGCGYQETGQPEEVADAILFFASDDADFITGQVLSVSGGLTMHG
jgi:NAD(P)-dependent dehydrogenase (short-subunit alcohol dehydrogenase family)